MRTAKKAAIVATAMALPMALAPAVMASGGSSMDGQEQAYRAIRAANIEAQAAGGQMQPTSFSPCVRGVARGTEYACDKVQLLAHIPLGMLGMTFGNDIWGWTAPDGEREWAIMSGTEGTAFVEVTDPKRPVVTGFLPHEGALDQQIWGDVKEVNDHLYVGTEDTGSGLQVFDLSRLLDAGPGTEFTTDAKYTGFSSSHNIVAHEDSSTVYAVGADVCAGGLHAVDVSDPLVPVFAGCFDTNGYVHDAHCVTYDGPDSDHTGKTICVAATSNFDGAPFIRTELATVDMTDPMNPVPLSIVEYNDGGFGYSHQGWLTEDHATFVLGDELDEYDDFEDIFGDEFFADNTSSYIWDVSDLDNISLIERVFHDTEAIDHNLFIDNGHVFAGNYTSGLRVYDASGLADGEMEEVAFFDADPSSDAGIFQGVWGTYPFFAQDHLVAISSSERGLFILKVQVGEK